VPAICQARELRGASSRRGLSRGRAPGPGALACGFIIPLRSWLLRGALPRRAAAHADRGAACWFTGGALLQALAAGWLLRGPGRWLAGWLGSPSLSVRNSVGAAYPHAALSVHSSNAQGLGADARQRATGRLNSYTAARAAVKAQGQRAVRACGAGAHLLSHLSFKVAGAAVLLPQEKC